MHQVGQRGRARQSPEHAPVHPVPAARAWASVPENQRLKLQRRKLHRRGSLQQELAFQDAARPHAPRPAGGRISAPMRDSMLGFLLTAPVAAGVQRSARVKTGERPHSLKLRWRLRGAGRRAPGRPGAAWRSRSADQGRERSRRSGSGALLRRAPRARRGSVGSSFKAREARDGATCWARPPALSSEACGPGQEALEDQSCASCCTYIGSAPISAVHRLRRRLRPGAPSATESPCPPRARPARSASPT